MKSSGLKALKKVVVLAALSPGPLNPSFLGPSDPPPESADDMSKCPKTLIYRLIDPDYRSVIDALKAGTLHMYLPLLWCSHVSHFKVITTNNSVARLGQISLLNCTKSTTTAPTVAGVGITTSTTSPSTYIQPQVIYIFN